MTILEEIWIFSAIVAIYTVPTVVILYNIYYYTTELGAKQ